MSAMTYRTAGGECSCGNGGALTKTTNARMLAFDDPTPLTNRTVLSQSGDSKKCPGNAGAVLAREIWTCFKRLFNAVTMIINDTSVLGS